MSFPKNPLDDYRSYSYHNILLVGNTTEALRPFLGSDNLDVDASLLSAITNTKQGEAVKVPDDVAAKIGAQTSSAAAYLVIDSRRTSNFSIREFNYSTSPGTGTTSQTHIFTGLLNMTVVDPDGIVFINYLRYLVDEKLKSDFYGIHFLLKTIFVGHKADGSTDFITTSSIPLMLHDLEFDVSFKEGVYYLKFVPMMQNVATMIKQYAIIKDAKAVSALDGKLGTIIKNFEANVNTTYRTWYRNFNVNQKLAGQANDIAVGKTGRLVQIMITIPPSWEEYNVSASFDQTFEMNFQAEKKKREDELAKKQKEADDARNKQIADEVEKGTSYEVASNRIKKQTISFNATLTVYDVIAEIFKLCDEVNKMANKDSIANNNVKLFKTISSITSNEEVIIAHFDIVEFEVPNITLDKDATFDKWFITDDAGVKKPLNSMEFDYIFSGKNTDITEFALKMQMGQALLMNNTSKMGTTTHRMINDQKSQADSPTTLDKKNLVFVRENDPITFPMETIDQKTNFAYLPEKPNVDAQRKSQEARNEWIQSVAFMHGASSLNVKMTIRGNPELLNKFIVDIIQPHVVPDTIKIADSVGSESFVKNTILGSYESWQTAKKLYRERVDKYFEDHVKSDLKKLNATSTNIPGKKAHAFPFFVKVNVFAPNSMDFGSVTQTLNPAAGAYTKFWYDGWYLVFQIDNKFADGVFTQELNIGAFELFGPETTTTTGGGTTTPAKA